MQLIKKFLEDRPILMNPIFLPMPYSDMTKVRLSLMEVYSWYSPRSRYRLTPQELIRSCDA
jgi:hypothetical protein